MKTLWIPLPLHPAWVAAANNDNEHDEEEYIPICDLFTSLAISIGYEWGWQQGFAQYSSALVCSKYW